MWDTNVLSRLHLSQIQSVRLFLRNPLPPESFLVPDLLSCQALWWPWWSLVAVMLIALLCPTLCSPIHHCHPLGSSVHGIFQARMLEWVALLFSRGSSQTKDRTQVSFIPGRFLIWEAPRKPLVIITFSYSYPYIGLSSTELLQWHCVIPKTRLWNSRPSFCLGLSHGSLWGSQPLCCQDAQAVTWRWGTDASHQQPTLSCWASEWATSKRIVPY